MKQAAVQAASRDCQFWDRGVRSNSLLEETGLELPVPITNRRFRRTTEGAGALERAAWGGTESSNPLCSRRESIANLTPAVAERPGRSFCSRASRGDRPAHRAVCPSRRARERHRRRRLRLRQLLDHLRSASHRRVVQAGVTGGRRPPRDEGVVGPGVESRCSRTNLGCLSARRSGRTRRSGFSLGERWP